MGAKKMKSGLGSKLKNIFSLGGNKKSSTKAQAKNNLYTAMTSDQRAQMQTSKQNEVQDGLNNQIQQIY